MEQLRAVGGALLIFFFYGLFFWRLFKSNPGNRLIECRSLTPTVFLTMIPIKGVGDIPERLFGAWLILVAHACLVPSRKESSVDPMTPLRCE